MNAFTQMMQRAGGVAPIGSWIMSASPIVAEAMGHAGFAWGVVDMEHTPLDMMEVVHMLQALSATPLLPIVRVPWNDTVGIKRVLDAGATTIMVPFVQSAEEARAAVAATRYPPQGRRGMAGMSRGSKFGTTPDYFAAANRTMAVIAQLETPEAIAALGQIAGVEGVTALFVGPGDLSGAMGWPGQVMHPELLALTAQAVAQAKAAGLPIGTVGGTAEAVMRYREMGFDFVGIASDLGLLMRSAQSAIAALHAGGAAAGAAAPTQGGY